jgi:hypothetical protein
MRDAAYPLFVGALTHIRRAWVSGSDLEHWQGIIQEVVQMVTIIAVIPLAVALALMTLLQRNSRQVGLVTLVLVCVLACVVPAFHLSPLHLLLLSLGQGGATALSVLTVLLPALLLYQLQRVTGGMHHQWARSCPVDEVYQWWADMVHAGRGG